jgi:hypothetical protein
MGARMTITDVLAVLSCCEVLTATASSRRGRLALASALTAAAVVTDTVLSVLWALRGDTVLSALWAVAAVIWAWLWWQNRGRRRKRKALRALGHKIRARLAAMARNMPGPSPARRPVPQGA